MSAVHAARAALWRLALFTAAWCVLADGIAVGGLVGAATIGSATAVSLYLQPVGSWRWTVAGLVLFVPYFLRQSVSGGLDVAGRALLPHRRLAPALMDYPLRLPDGPARRFFAGAIGLLPGTLTAELHADHLTVHVLDRNLPVASMLGELERRTASLFGVPLP